jgi:hypothetical protein
MVCNTAPPPKNILDSWKKQVKLWIKNASTSNFDKIFLLQNLDDLWDEVEDAFARSKSYADFNAFFQTKVVNNLWGYKTLFVRLSDISPVFDKGFEFLLSNYDKYSNAVEKAESYFVQRKISTGVSSRHTSMLRFGFIAGAEVKLQLRYAKWIQVSYSEESASHVKVTFK